MKSKQAKINPKCHCWHKYEVKKMEFDPFADKIVQTFIKMERRCCHCGVDSQEVGL